MGIFVSKLCVLPKIEKNQVFLHFEKYLEINRSTRRAPFCDVAYGGVIMTSLCGRRHLYLRNRYVIIHCTAYSRQAAERWKNIINIA